MTFLVAGVQKGGTTSLDAYLRQHPSICMARKKELHFFDKDPHFEDKPVDYAGYESRFAAKLSATIFGEATPIYTYWPPAMERIKAYSRAMKIIVLLRNPIERAWSHWRMEVGRNREALDFSTAIRNEPERIAMALSKSHQTFSYVDRGLYSRQIERIRMNFPEPQLLFIKSERFFVEPAEVVAEVLRFLDLPLFHIDVSQVHRAGHDASHMSPEDRSFLRDKFIDDAHAVERALGWDCSDWLDLRTARQGMSRVNSLLVEE